MSAYENYAAISAHCDRIRVPIGIEIILGCLAAGRGSLTSLRLLDAGCGTGSYTAVLRPYVGAIDAVDLNPSMLGVARAKLDHVPGCPVALHEAGIDALPFEDGRFDAVMVNQVLHHLPDATYRKNNRPIRVSERVCRTGRSTNERGSVVPWAVSWAVSCDHLPNRPLNRR